MASIPSTGDRLTAKVDLVMYADGLLSKQFPPLLPGPGGLRETVQYPGNKKLGEEVGTFTGELTDQAFEVNYILKYRVAKQGFWPGQWSYNDVIKQVKLWVKKSEVTGNWDKGVDAPKEKKEEELPPPDNTNMILGVAVGLATLFKFVLPRFKQNGENR